MTFFKLHETILLIINSIISKKLIIRDKLHIKDNIVK